MKDAPGQPQGWSYGRNRNEEALMDRSKLSSRVAELTGLESAATKDTVDAS